MESPSEALVFDSDGRELVGILDRAPSQKQRGILMVTGGPQYRVGSHRQFVLLARSFRDQGYPVFRFDYRGMGDSDGSLTDFLHCRNDVLNAKRIFEEEAGVREIVLWGLCDGASGSLMYVADEPPVAGLVLINPWVRSDASLARVYLRHYYVRRLFSGDFLRQLASGKFRVGKSLKELLDNFLAATSTGEPVEERGESGISSQPTRDFRETMRDGMSSFKGPVLLILSGNDLTAREFVDHANEDRRWRKILRRESVTVQRLEGADHTFSTQVWRDRVADWTTDWMETW